MSEEPEPEPAGAATEEPVEDAPKEEPTIEEKEAVEETPPAEAGKEDGDKEGEEVSEVKDVGVAEEVPIIVDTEPVQDTKKEEKKGKEKGAKKGKKGKNKKASEDGENEDEGDEGAKEEPKAADDDEGKEDKTKKKGKKKGGKKEVEKADGDEQPPPDGKETDTAEATSAEKDGAKKKEKKEKGAKKPKKGAKEAEGEDKPPAEGAVATTEDKPQEKPEKKGKKKGKDKKSKTDVIEEIPKQVVKLDPHPTISQVEQHKNADEMPDSSLEKEGSSMITASRAGLQEISRSLHMVDKSTSKVQQRPVESTKEKASSSSSSSADDLQVTATIKGARRKSASLSGSVIVKKGKKGKKGKEKKKEEEEKVEGEKMEPSTQISPDVDVSKKGPKKGAKETAPEQDIVAEKKPKEAKAKKPKKGGKKTKMTADMIEKMRQEQEENAKKQEAEERRLKLEETLREIEREKRETYEHGIRIDQLTQDKLVKEEVVEFNMQIKEEEDLKNEWETYIKCRVLPNASKCPELTTYLHVWKTEIDLTSMDEASKRTADVLETLNDLEDALITYKNAGRIYDNLIWVRQLLRDCQDRSLDVATYRLLRFVETRMNRVNMYLSDLNFQDDNVIFCLWLRKQLPIPLPNPRRPPRPRIEVQFELLKMTVLCPASLEGEGIAIRAMYLTYDHYSDLSESYYMPEVSDIFDMDLITYTSHEWRTKLKYKFDNRIKQPKRQQQEEEATEGAEDDDTRSRIYDEDIEIGPDDPIPVVSYRKLDPTPDEYVCSMEEKLYADTREHMYRYLPEDIVNLRQYSILGGIYKVDLVLQPPQPQDFILIDMYITTLFLPKELEYLPFFIEYVAPILPEGSIIRTPEEIEEDLKRTEEEMDKLILITLKWPDHVLFLDLPIVCFWEPKANEWTRAVVFDLKHVEDTGILSFRTQRFGTFALANLRYSHLPIQTWELRPEEDGTATLQITSAILIFEFNVKDNLVSLSQLQNCPNNALKDAIGKYYKLHILIRMMREAGMDIFPSFDAFCYVEGVCEKHYHTEQHLYKNMAQLVTCFNFTWSRWNTTTGRRTIVMQMREYTPNKGKQKSYSMAMITPFKATFIDCTEISQSFVEDDVEGIKFCADLYQLMKATSSIFIRSTVNSANKQIVYHLANLLMATRLHSFS